MNYLNQIIMPILKHTWQSSRPMPAPVSDKMAHTHTQYKCGLPTRIAVVPMNKIHFRHEAVYPLSFFYNRLT